MNIREKFYEIMEKEDDFDELFGEVKDMLDEAKLSGKILDYEMNSDIDVYDSPGMDVYYLSIAWVKDDGELNIAGTSYYSC